MNKHRFQILCTVLVAVAILPLTTFIVYELPVRERVWWSIALLIIALLFKKFVYNPIERRMPD
jgi:hypothetical protein